MYKISLWVLDWMQRCPTHGDEKYHHAMMESGYLLQEIAEAKDDPAIAMIADILANRHNAPYITTVYEAMQEVNSPIKQQAASR